MAKGKTWRLGKITIEHQPNGRWGASDGCHGTGGFKTPFGALWTLWRFKRIARDKPE